LNMFRLSITTIAIALLIGFVQVVQIQTNSSGQVNAVEQSEIKGAIESYFENRYRALSILKLEEFQSLTDQSPEGEAFLNAEMDKLEIEIQHAKNNQLRYSQYEFFLRFDDISIDRITQMSTVSVVEGHDVVFEISEKISPAEPIVSSMRNLEHTIVLHKEQGEWKIVSDYYEDYLWRLIRTTGMSKNEFLQSMAVSHNQLPSENGIQSITSCSLPSDESTHPYNRNGAIDYAHQWATAPRPYNSPPYYDFTDFGGDCTNFTSQALHEGGTAQMIGSGTLGWYFNSVNDYSPAWTGVSYLYDFITQYWVWPAGPEGCVVSKDNAQPGDLIQYEWEGGEEWDHGVIIVESIDMGYGDMYHLVAGHTPDVDDYPYYYFHYGDPSKIYRYIRVERIDGYFMVYLPLVLKNSGGRTSSQPQLPYQNPYPAPIENIEEPVPISPYPAP